MRLQSQTSITLFDQPQASVGPAASTVIIFGVNRGGTSMVAGVVRGFGYHLGAELAVNNEDVDFAYRSHEEMRRSIAQRNERFSLWGWKFPRAAEYLDGLLDVVRNPKLIVVNRDIVATSLGLLRWDERQPGDALLETLDQMQKNLALVSRWRKPSLFVSYEKAVAAPDAFLQELSVFLNRPLAVDKSRMVKFMAAGSYKSYDHVVVGNAHLAARFGQPS